MPAEGKLRVFSHVLVQTANSNNILMNFSGDKHSLTLVVSGNSPQVHCMWDSALSKLSEGLTTSSESLFGEKA